MLLMFLFIVTNLNKPICVNRSHFSSEFLNKAHQTQLLTIDGMNS